MEEEDASAAEPPSPRLTPATDRPATEMKPRTAACLDGAGLDGAGLDSACLDIDILDPARFLSRADVAQLHEEASCVLGQLHVIGEVRARIVDDAQMSQAHEKYAHVPGTTDVLTFDLRENADDPLDVDLLLCIDEATRQSAKLGHSVERELLLYLIHGVLHCVGYDDHTPADAQRMHAKEDALLGAVGIDPVYAARAPGQHTARTEGDV